MEIIVSGSLGHIGKPLTQELVGKGYAVTVISSNPEKQKDIEVLGATAAIGTLKDADFHTATFTGSDAVYTMVPPANYFNPIDLSVRGIAYELGFEHPQSFSKLFKVKTTNK